MAYFVRQAKPDFMIAVGNNNYEDGQAGPVELLAIGSNETSMGPPSRHLPLDQ